MWFSASDFLPHSICLALDPTILWLHAASDAITALSYYSIPIVLIIFARRRAEGHYRWLLLLFAAFVLACGTTHLMSIVTLWWPIYLEQGIIKAMTGVVSVVTAVVMWRLLPQALSVPTPAELSRQVAERQDAERKMRDMNNHLEARVRERTEELERANQAKSRFLAAASHDLRQPFQAMVLYREILDLRLSDSADRDVLSALGNAMTAGQDLLNALLHISSLEAGTTVSSIEAIPLRHVLEPLATEFADQAVSQGLRFRVVPCSAIVTTDKALFPRIVRNFLTNALKYTDSGTVLFGCRKAGTNVRVEIWDSGSGVPPEKQSEIWEEFAQLDNPERDRAKGLGLGLAIATRTAELLGHRVGMRSWHGQGSVFFVELPLAKTGSMTGKAPVAATATDHPVVKTST